MRKFSIQRALIHLFPFLLLLIFAATGCATRSAKVVTSRTFSFEQDTFTYANELKWEYHFEPGGKWTGTKRQPEPDYSLHCFVVARSCCQFFQNARFNAELPRVSADEYRKLVHKVVSIDPRHDLRTKIVIPGYSDLRDFSRDHEMLLKDECGGAWQSYFQRGNWRMVFPFTRNHQEKTAQKLCAKITNGRLPVAHVVQFPELSINHAVVVYGFTNTEDGIKFMVYDPNQPEAPTSLLFDRTSREFQFPQNNYFAGGSVNVYEIYRSVLF